MQEIAQDIVANPWGTVALLGCAAIGAAHIASTAWRFLGYLNRQFIRRPYNFYQRYAKPSAESWVLVTGGSDGIGLEICHQMAAQGFHVLIVSRNAEKMEQKCGELRERFPKLKFEHLTADFGNMATYSDYASLADKVGDKDLAMIFLNAGGGVMGPFTQISNGDLERAINLNALHPLYLAKALVDKQMSRGHKSALVVTSSMASIQPLGGMLNYCMSKSFVSFMAQGLYHELKQHVDVLDWAPGEINTNLLPASRRSAAQTTEGAVKAMFKDLGKQKRTYGSFESMVWQFSFMPADWLYCKMLPALAKAHAKAVELGRAESK